MKIFNIQQTVAKSRTISGMPCIVVEKQTPNAAGLPSEGFTLAILADNELGNELADALIEEINRGKARL